MRTDTKTEPKTPEPGRLIDDIHSDAAQEAERIKTETTRQLEERTAQYERQLSAVAAEARVSAERQVSALKKSIAASRTVELRKIALQSRERVFKKITARVEEKFRQLVTEARYRTTLLGWITEAAIGLGAPRAVVNASPAELALLDAALLQEASAAVRRLTHQEVVITRSTEPALLLQGIILASEDGKTAYNNQVRTRIVRNHGMIRKVIYDRLMHDAQGEV